MSIRQLASQVVVKHGGTKGSLTSDAYTGLECDFTGFENVLAIVETATPSTSVAVLTVSFQKQIAAGYATDAAASDWAAIASDCSIVAQAYAASTTTYLGVIDITIPSSDTQGSIRASVLTPGEGLTVDGLTVTYICYNGSQMHPNTDYAPAYWPA